MDLQLLSKHIVILHGYIWLMLASVTESSTPTINQVDSREWECNPPCNNAKGEFCLLSRCIPCGYCPQDPFDIDRNGHLTIFTPCVQNGFCPRVCSSYLNLGDHPQANDTFCEQIKAPKVTTAQSTTGEAVETTTANPTGLNSVTSVKPETNAVIKPHVKVTNVDSKGLPLYAFFIPLSALVIVGLAVYCSKQLIRKLDNKRRDSSTSSLTQDTDDQYKELEIQLNAENRTVTVKGLVRINCNALQLCSCLYNPDRPPHDWMPTGGLDEIELLGPMIPHQVYTVKAGKVSTTREFKCIGGGNFNTKEFSNVTLEEECSTKIKYIFETSSLRKSLEVELYQEGMINNIATVFKVEGDSYIFFKYRKSLDELYNETLIGSEVVESSIHILLKGLVEYSEAKDFVRKIAKRDTNRYCKKCLELLHRMCCGNPDECVVSM